MLYRHIKCLDLSNSSHYRGYQYTCSLAPYFSPNSIRIPVTSATAVYIEPLLLCQLQATQSVALIDYIGKHEVMVCKMQLWIQLHEFVIWPCLMYCFAWQSDNPKYHYLGTFTIFNKMFYPKILLRLKPWYCKPKYWYGLQFVRIRYLPKFRSIGKITWISRPRDFARSYG